MPELDRRDFLKIVGMTAGAAATVACKDPVEKVIPYLNQPEEVIPGIPTFYHSACRECPSACATTVKTREGRPIKVEGRFGDPSTGGGTCVRGQASLQRLYDADRFRGPQKRQGDGFVQITWEEAMNTLVEKLRGSAGRSVFLSGNETGTRDAVIDRALTAIGSPRRLRYEPFGHEALRAANDALFGTASVPRFDLGAADVIVAFGTDFLETWLGTAANQHAYKNGRRNARGFAAFVGPRLGLSAGNTDQWLAANPGTEILIALALAHDVSRRKNTGGGAIGTLLADYRPENVAAATGIEAAKIKELAGKIASARRPLALPPGAEVQGTNATAFAAAVQILNWVSGAIGRTVVFGPDQNVAKLARFGDLKDLAGKVRGGEVGVLLVHGANPVYDAPQVGLADAIRSGSAFVVSFSSANDETTALADLVLPDHTPFESWGDPEPIVGSKRLQQPTIQPLFDTRSTPDVLLDVARALGRGSGLPATFYDALEEAWGGIAALTRALASAEVPKGAPNRRVALSGDVGSIDFGPAPLAGKDGDLVLVAYPSLHFYDGRSARLSMLKEIPDPVIKTVWNSFAEMSETDAEQMGIEMGDLVDVSTDAGSVQLPAFPHKAIRPGVVAIQVGQGHQPINLDTEAPDPRAKSSVVGVNAYALIPGRLDERSGGLAWLSTRASVRKATGRAIFARLQQTFDQEERGMAKAVLASAYLREKQKAHGDHGAHDDHGTGHGDGHGGHHGPPEGFDVYGTAGEVPIQGDASHLITKEYDPGADAGPESPYRWGLDLDLDACAGCNACVAACMVENNTPVVGADNARIGREMQWIRVARYVESVDDRVDVRHAPSMCQHCGAAPCESVCPALATYHSVEGLNVMVPNRCIGTRFCSNNCPYKARRFNHYSYNWFYEEPENLMLNPDVMVRAKGVMEKCTMCLQRIQDGKGKAQIAGREVRDGDFTTACAQACPSQAIVFGNLRDKKSRVTKLRNEVRAYRVLEHLYTRPGVSYQMKIVRNDEHEA